MRSSRISRALYRERIFLRLLIEEGKNFSEIMPGEMGENREVTEYKEILLREMERA